MKTSSLIAALTLAAICGFGDELPRSQSNTNGVVFREPFTLKLHVDKEHYYEQELPKLPYVFKNDIYLLKGDFFGIDFQSTNGTVQSISYQSETNKAAVTFRFTQEVKDGNAMMLLVIENRTKHKLFIDALMTVPKKDRPQKTTIIPVHPGLSSYESWPHPIVQLVLRDVRFNEKRGSESSGAANGSQPGRAETNRVSSPAGSRR